MWNARARFTHRDGPDRRRCLTIDDTILLEHLADGWPVWRIAEHYRATNAEVRQALGRAVTRVAGSEMMFGSG